MKRWLEVIINGDNKRLKRSFKDSEKAMGGFEKSVRSIGAKLVAVFAFDQVIRGFNNLIKTASDAQETLSKFDTVFRNVSKAADDSSKVLVDSYGLSEKASKELLGNTGDLLTGFGFSQKAALDLSTEVNKLAIDLASFTNFSGGAKGASDALTKALLGERESVKALGISILEEDVKKQVAINTAKGLIFETERQAKAYATLEIAISQSANAVGDYERTSESFANQQRELRARIEDLSTTLGNAFLPAASNATGALTDYVNKANEFFKDVLTPTNMGALEKWARVLASGALGAVTGGRAGRGLTAEITQRAQDERAPEENIEKFLSGIDSVIDKEERRAKIVEEIIYLQNKSRELLRSEDEALQRIGQIYKEQYEIMQANTETYVNLKQEQVDADLAAAAEADAKAAEQERNRLKALGEIGNLVEQLKTAEADFISANSESDRVAAQLRINALKQEIEMLTERAELLASRQTSGPLDSSGLTPMPSLGGGLIDSQSEIIEGLKQQQIELKKTGEAAAEAQQGFIDFSNAATGAAYEIGAAFGEMAQAGARSTEEIIGQMLRQITALLLQSIMASALPLPAKLAAALGAGALSSGIFSSQVPSYATGTSNHPGGLALVGERGPELVNLPGGSQVFTNRESIGMMGGKVEFEIRGDKLYGLLQRYSNRLNQNT